MQITRCALRSRQIVDHQLELALMVMRSRLVEWSSGWLSITLKSGILTGWSSGVIARSDPGIALCFSAHRMAGFHARGAGCACCRAD